MKPVLIGAVCGLTWAAGLAAGLRGLMSVLAGPSSAVNWYGTFVQILLPGAIVGALLGHATRTRDRRTWSDVDPVARRIVALAPVPLWPLTNSAIPFRSADSRATAGSPSRTEAAPPPARY